MPNRYPPALREQIVLEYRQGHSIRALTKDFEPCEEKCHRWVEDRLDTRLDESEQDGTSRFRKENKQLREDKQISEKAAAWFATICNKRYTQSVPSISACKGNR